MENVPLVPGLEVQKYLDVDATSSLGSDENGGSARGQCSAAVSHRRGWGVWEENKDEPVCLCLKKKKKSPHPDFPNLETVQLLSVCPRSTHSATSFQVSAHGPASPLALGDPARLELKDLLNCFYL